MDEINKSGYWDFDSPFFMILNIAVGGGFVGDATADTKFLHRVYFDYVLVYPRAVLMLHQM